MPTATPTSTTTLDVANAVAAEINSPVAGTVWIDASGNFTCERRRVPRYTDEELASALRLTVVAGKEEDVRTARKLVSREHTVIVWFQKKLADPDPDAEEAAIDAISPFAYQVKDYFIAAGRVLSQLANVHCMRATVRAEHSPDDLIGMHSWVTAIELTFMETTNQ